MEYDPEKKLCQLTLYLLDPVSFLSSAAAVAFIRISSYLFNNASCNSDRWSNHVLDLQMKLIKHSNIKVSGQVQSQSHKL